jgi:hypothetical protein
MNLLCKSQTDTRKADEYAISEDFYRLFKEDVEGLYLLSYMLTADHEKAERCFVGGLEDSVNGNPVYKQWARSWARRQIIQRAIRTIAPDLAALERFVFVMSTLEGYSDQECSILLGCSRGEVITARTQALRRLSKLDADHVLPFADAVLHPVTETHTL